MRRIVFNRPPRRAKPQREPKPAPQVGPIVRPERRDEMTKEELEARGAAAGRLFQRVTGKEE
jgi:hypothetical protein